MAAAPAVTVPFTVPQYAGETSFFSSGQPYLLPQSAGWASVFGFSAVFAGLALLLVYIDVKFNKVSYQSEHFQTASRSVKAGLIAIDTVSHWTWASILLQCVSYGWLYGMSGSYWYAVNDAVVMFLFGSVALEMKHRAPHNHTILEIIRVRWGVTAHVVFYFFATVTNLLVSISMLQGATAVVNALTGANSYALGYIIPLGVVAYAVIGGLKSTFVTAWMHGVIIYVVTCIFMFVVFVNSKHELLGSIDIVYTRLQELATYVPVANNKGGSYLTMYSDGGLQFEVIFFFSALSQMFVDQGFWQSAIAADGVESVKGYFLGSYLFLSIVFALPVCVGGAALALGLPFTVTEALEGLVLPGTAYVLLGKAGAVLIIVICFMAVTSSGASEMVAVSSLFTYDVYRQYINPKASGAKLLLVSRLGVFVWAVIMGIALTVVQVAGININWLITCIGVFVGGAVPPIIMALIWSKCSRIAATTACVWGNFAGIASWLCYAHFDSGSISVATTGLNGPLVCGNTVSLGMSLFTAIILSYVFPERSGKFDWKRLKTEIEKAEDPIGMDGKPVLVKSNAEQIARWRKPCWIISGTVFVLAMIVWPLLSLPAGIWSLAYFRFYVVMTFFFLLTSSIIVIVLPLWEGRDVFRALLGRDRRPVVGTTDQVLPDPKAAQWDDSAHGESDGLKAMPATV